MAVDEEWGWFAVGGWVLSVGIGGYAAEYATDKHRRSLFFRLVGCVTSITHPTRSAIALLIRARSACRVRYARDIREWEKPH